MQAPTINDAQTVAENTAGMLLASRYRIVRKLGQGGMGNVWLVEDTQLDNKLFAIKMLPTILVASKRAYRQLKDEAIVAMRLVHPNIVQIRAFEENSGNPFLVMDYIDGRTLDEYLDKKGKLGAEDVVRILRPIATALDYAHGEGVVHRDVKPANVMIRKDGHPFILDFGIAREIQETLTRMTGKFSSGTLLYMSPEQLAGVQPKPPQDVYSFATMAYECLTGAPPFVRGQIEYQIINNPPPPLRTSGRAVPIGAADILATGIMKGLAKKPEGRPTSCVAVLVGEKHVRNRIELATHHRKIVSPRVSPASRPLPPKPVAGNLQDVFAPRPLPRPTSKWRWGVLPVLLLLAAVLFVLMNNRQHRQQEAVARRQALIRLANERAAAESAKARAEQMQQEAMRADAKTHAFTSWNDAEKNMDLASKAFARGNYVLAGTNFVLAAQIYRQGKEQAATRRREIADNARREAEKHASGGASAIRELANIQNAAVARLSDEDGFRAQKEKLEKLRAKAELSYKQKRWEESRKLFSDCVEQGKALVALDGDRIGAVEQRAAVQQVWKNAEALGAKRLVSQWNEAVALWNRATEEFALMKFAQSAESFAVASHSFKQCEEEAQKIKKREEKARQEAETLREEPIASGDVELAETLREMDDKRPAEEFVERPANMNFCRHCGSVIVGARIPRMCPSCGKNLFGN